MLEILENIWIINIMDYNLIKKYQQLILFLNVIVYYI